VRLAQTGNKEAFEELVRRHQHRVFAVAGGILRRREDVEDIAQASLRQSLFFDQALRSARGLQHLLYKITVRVLGSPRKKKVRPLLYESDLSERGRTSSSAQPKSSRAARKMFRTSLKLSSGVEILLQGWMNGIA